MARKTWWIGLVLAALSSAGCCRWCERWCGHQQHAQPMAYAQPCVPCCPVQCCPTAPAPVQPQFQRGPYGCP